MTVNELIAELQALPNKDIEILVNVMTQTQVFGQAQVTPFEVDRSYNGATIHISLPRRIRDFKAEGAIMRNTLIALTLGLMFTVSASAAPKSCKYNGKLSPAWESLLKRTAGKLKHHPDASVIAIGGDDETGEYLVSLGIDPARISELPSADGRLSFKLVYQERVILIDPIRPSHAKPSAALESNDPRTEFEV